MAQTADERRLAELESAVERLSDKEYEEFRSWFLERDWQAWDRQLDTDARAGKLDFLAREARQAKSTGRLRRL